ncbi:MAG: 2-amino-thiazoline-4-carboxylic acid hydrolase [Rhodospirillales bacterium]|nr:2-amino-thiazoline-4-carboxylic acid hydrolase [Rhodospirillales bacterium]
MNVPVIEQARIQAQVLVPLVKALQAELGEERANALVRKALGDHYRKFGEKWWKSQGARDLGEKMAAAFEGFAAAAALDYDVLKKDSQSFEANVTGCRFAEFYKKIGASELGFLLVCSSDFAMTEGFGDPVQLARTQTIMQGATHCDFRYRLEKA